MTRDKTRKPHLNEATSPNRQKCSHRPKFPSQKKMAQLNSLSPAYFLGSWSPPPSSGFRGGKISVPSHVTDGIKWSTDPPRPMLERGIDFSDIAKGRGGILSRGSTSEKDPDPREFEFRQKSPMVTRCAETQDMHYENFRLRLRVRLIVGTGSGLRLASGSWRRTSVQASSWTLACKPPPCLSQATYSLVFRARIFLAAVASAVARRSKLRRQITPLRGAGGSGWLGASYWPSPRFTFRAIK